MALRSEIFSEQKDKLGEGPLWDPKGERLYWIDSYGPAVHRADLNGGDRKSWSLPEPIGSMALREKGGAVLALRSGFHFLDFGSGEVARIVETQPDELRPRFNDGKVDRVIEMPVKKVTSVMFGGPNLDVLYVPSIAKPPLPRRRESHHVRHGNSLKWLANLAARSRRR